MTHDINVKIYNLDSSEYVDITEICLEKKLVRRHNQSRALSITVPSGHSLVTSAFGDGYPAMQSGDRKLYVERDSSPIYHGRIFNVERTGDGEVNRATMTAFDPLMEMGYESEDRAGRPVRDSTSNFVTPEFASPITGADLIYEILTTSAQTGTESDPTPGEGPHPIDLTLGTFSSTADLSPENNMSWPVMIGDFIAQLIASGQIDIDLRPVAIGEAPDPYSMVALSVVDLFGSDLSGTVHFDYWTGDRNAKSARHVEDFSTICNKLYDYLGPKALRPDGTVWVGHWAGNITPGTAGTTVDPTDSRARYGGPGSGQFMQIRILDANDTENIVRPLFLANWNAEMQYRVTPRPLLFLTPNPDEYALYEPFSDYDCGDLISVNVGGDFGVNISAIQRVYGYDVEWDREGIERVTNLIVSADPE